MVGPSLIEFDEEDSSAVKEKYKETNDTLIKEFVLKLYAMLMDAFPGVPTLVQKYPFTAEEQKKGLPLPPRNMVFHLAVYDRDSCFLIQCSWSLHNTRKGRENNLILINAQMSKNLLGLEHLLGDMAAAAVSSIQADGYNPFSLGRTVRAPPPPLPAPLASSGLPQTAEPPLSPPRSNTEAGDDDSVVPPASPRVPNRDDLEIRGTRVLSSESASGGDESEDESEDGSAPMPAAAAVADPTTSGFVL